MVAIAPDNYFTLKGIARLKEVERDPNYKECYHICTKMRVFVFNFSTYVEQGVKGLCNKWATVWPCVYRKNPKWVLVVGSEILRKEGTFIPLIRPRIQREPYPNAVVLRDVINYHYKGVKTYDSRQKRYGEVGAKRWKNYPIDGPLLKKYKGEHPEILDEHPWRHIEDCRKESSDFDWQKFIHLVER
jgi:hypothetical protein